jgi:F0F1-type ATP synthase membrane subunit c/vacuolar-type H+-ATPase subunit K
MMLYRTAEVALFATGLAIGVACANDSSAQDREGVRVIPDDTVGIVKLLSVVRGANPLVCEMATRTADMRGSWSMWGPLSGDPLVMDSLSAALLDWIQHQHNDPTVVPRLRTAMQENDGCVRRVASSLLSRVRHPTAVSALLSALDDRQAGTREVAAFGLGMAQAPVATDALEQTLRDPEPAVRRAAAWALGQMEVKKAVPALIELLAHDSDARVRQTAAWAIGSIR